MDQNAVWERMDVRGVSQNEVARKASVSRSHLSEIIAGKATPWAKVLHWLHGVLYRRSSKEERVMPVDVQVLAWRKGARSGVVAPGGLIPAVWRRRLAAAGVCGGHWYRNSPSLEARYGHPRATSIAGLTNPPTTKARDIARCIGQRAYGRRGDLLLGL